MKTVTFISDKKIPEFDCYFKPFAQLCWNCRRVFNVSCEWMKDYSAVDGWDALEDESYHGRSYFIFKCPKYQPIQPAKIIKCYNCGKEFSSYADNVFCCSKCYKEYKPALLTNVCERCGKTYQCQSTKRKFCTQCLYDMRRKNKLKGDK